MVRKPAIHGHYKAEEEKAWYNNYKDSRENKMENDKMNGWTKKRKVDTFMGILLQVYCFFPWMRINRKWNTIHRYVIKTFQENDYIKMYNHTFLKQHMWKWNIHR